MTVSWSTNAISATQLTSVTTGSYFDVTPALDPNQYAHVQVSGETTGTTDGLDFKVYATLDSSSETWDSVPITSFNLSMDSTVTNDVSFIVSDVFKFRVRASRDGATDSFTADMKYRLGTMS